MDTKIFNAEAVIRHICKWLTEYCESAGSGGFVVGVSGGIDSAVTSGLAARTGKPVMCLEMPIHQPASHVSRARKHIEHLQASYSSVSLVHADLTPVFDQFVATLPAQGDADRRFLSLANSRARLRMTTLYYFAALHGFLVTGTGNRVEDFGVGFYTKYGDGGVDLSPVADLTKTEVYALAAEMKVIEEIQVAPPTDGLWLDDRSDEDQIGASYPELEWAMDFIASGDTAGQKRSLTERQREVLRIYEGFHAANQHKMQPIPVCEVPDAVKNEA